MEDCVIDVFVVPEGDSFVGAAKVSEIEEQGELLLDDRIEFLSEPFAVLEPPCVLSESVPR